ncbi:Serine/threonine-protein kinase rsbT [uncultured Roseburia sp.]|uniref:ATP-binding protein n=1 Tax=Brotonthovivens ammoniilytica TaxID=2981725 RepID=A0ABT2TGJ6_9FIRM|nr:ATP-binding protein [Brotonthovivens ammoniilytica]MCU6761313.1 ATP-binding protein [Brotonthovivens ammoniilytica]SCI25012.1 Serine/threonine-protein kinase rsbT [uncultured Roseburia sp.]
MENKIHFKYEVDGEDFTRAGEASSDIKSKLKLMQIQPDIVRRVAIAMYEGEINMIIHANGGVIDVDVYPEKLTMILKDSGPGIKNIEQAMEEGYSTAPDEIVSLGFGAGMGLPNMKRASDEMDVSSTVGVGTTVTMTINF